MQQSSTHASILHLFIRQIEAIKFSDDWIRQDSESGGKIYKTNFLKSVFERQSGQYAGAGRSPQTAIDFQKFKRQFRR